MGREPKVNSRSADIACALLDSKVGCSNPRGPVAAKVQGRSRRQRTGLSRGIESFVEEGKGDAALQGVVDTRFLVPGQEGMVERRLEWAATRGSPVSSRAAHRRAAENACQFIPEPCTRIVQRPFELGLVVGCGADEIGKTRQLGD